MISIKFSSRLTCTVALGIQARDIKIFSFILKPANRTTQNVTNTRTSKPTHRVATPKPTDRRDPIYTDHVKRKIVL